jgi:hypothetical protein
MAISPNADRNLARSTRDVLRAYIGDEGDEIATGLERLNEVLPAVVAGPDQRLRAAEKQISWGITRQDGRYKVIILSEGNEIHRTVQSLGKTYDGVFVTRVPGRAHSFDPASAIEHRRHLAMPDRAPGASIGHVSGYPGTLGCFVQTAGANGNWIGAISASHVLGRKGQSKKGDDILSPGHPDGARVRGAKIGVLEDFSLLTDFQDISDNYLCCQDIALVKVTDMEDFPDRTMAWCPEDENKLIPIKEVIGGREVAERLGQPVYKRGRTTGLTRGILEIVGLQRQRIVIGGRDHIYTNILAVKCEDDTPFSKSGDSGALVYTEDGYPLGLVIAGTDQYSFVSPLDACLEDMKATLLA